MNQKKKIFSLKAAFAVVLLCAALVTALPSDTYAQIRGPNTPAAEPLTPEEEAIRNIHPRQRYLYERGRRQMGTAQTVPENSVTSAEATLDFSGLPNPLGLAADFLGLDFAQMFSGGEQSMNNWFKNWNDTWKPGMQDMTAQWHTAILDRSRNYGSALDAQNFAEDQLSQEKNEYEAWQKLEPSETACVVASGITGGGGSGGSGSGGGTGQGGLASAAHISSAVTRGLGEEMTREGLNAQGTPAAKGPAADYADRFAMYAKHFCDPEMNNGAAGCQPEGPQLKNADISVENFLLRDTIDMSSEVEKLASKAILRNLVQPNVPNPIAETSINSYTGQNAMVKRRELQALRNMPVAVVSGMIGRRTAIPDSNTAEIIRPIREAAGIPADEISDKASFNETMLALTKERFYDPAYFQRISSSSDAQIKQEQLSVDILTSITLRQIYMLQEQMNGLMAARASIKANGDSYGNLTAEIGSSTPQ